MQCTARIVLHSIFDIQHVKHIFILLHNCYTTNTRHTLPPVCNMHVYILYLSSGHILLLQRLLSLPTFNNCLLLREILPTLTNLCQPTPLTICEKLPPGDLSEDEERGEKIAMLTSYDYSMARLVDQAGIDVILVGDSASNVMAAISPLSR